MTKVNYFTHKDLGTEITQEDIAYGYSKRHAEEIFKNRGQEITGDIREMNFKTEVLSILDLKEQFEVRTRDKEIWAHLDSTTKVKKSSKPKKSKETESQE